MTTLPIEQIPEPTPVILPFPVNSKAYHIHSKVNVTIERDNGGATVYVSYIGGKSQSVPRGVLIPIEPPKCKGSTIGKANAALKKPRTAEATELVMFSREIQALDDIRALDKKYGLGVNISPVASFGMTKMQTMGKIRSAVKSGKLTIEQLWEGVRG